MMKARMPPAFSRGERFARPADTWASVEEINWVQGMCNLLRNKRDAAYLTVSLSLWLSSGSLHLDLDDSLGTELLFYNMIPSRLRRLMT